MKQGKPYFYLISRLLILIFFIFLIYHTAVYFLPEHIREDHFSFVGELNMVVHLTLAFSIFYSVFIFREYQKFKKKRVYIFKNAALIVLLISLLMVIVMLFITIKL